MKVMKIGFLWLPILTTARVSSISAESEERQGNDFIPAAIPTNLSAVADVYNSSRNLLRLNISWSSNPDGPPASSYNIHVWSLNDTTSHCGNEKYYVFIENRNATSWVISPEPMADALHEAPFSVLPDCSYRIRLEANPHNGKMYTERDYRVPDCVKDVCSCPKPSPLPKPQVYVQHLNNTTVNITWVIADQENISSFILRAGPKVTGGALSSVYNLSWSRQLTQQHQLFTAWQDGDHVATVNAVGARNCCGPDGRLTFTIQRKQNGRQDTTEKQLLWVVSVCAISVLFTLCVLTKVMGTSLSSWFDNNKQQTHFDSPRFLYKAIRIKSERVFRRNKIRQEWNVLYVDKEIEDAKARHLVDSFEISSNRLTFVREIGHGAFGQVFLARAEAIRGLPGTRMVAVKKLKANAGIEEKEEFLEEISMLKRVGCHRNIVSLLGCCTLQSDLYMVMEFVPCGDLLKYLQNIRQKLDARNPSVASEDSMYSTQSTVMTSLNSCTYSAGDQPSCMQGPFTVLNNRELHNFALQIARGMAHLELKKITHRDLAARNILVDDNKVLKISDFGLSRRGVYVNTRRRKVPLRWLSIEAMRDSLYCSKSDVWAFGIVLWEIGTLGGFPYPTVLDYDLLDFLKSGHRLEKPDLVSKKLYSVMLNCWSERPDDRPSFTELVSYLEPNHQVYINVPVKPCLPPISSNASIVDSPAAKRENL